MRRDLVRATRRAREARCADSSDSSRCTETRLAAAWLACPRAPGADPPQPPPPTARRAVRREGATPRHPVARTGRNRANPTAPSTRASTTPPLHIREPTPLVFDRDLGNHAYSWRTLSLTRPWRGSSPCCYSKDRCCKCNSAEGVTHTLLWRQIAPGRAYPISGAGVLLR